MSQPIPENDNFPIHKVQRHSFILTLWEEPAARDQKVWRGYIESGTGQRFYFSDTAELVRRIEVLCGVEKHSSTKELNE